MYIRFKDVPNDEISGVYDGDLGKIRDEAGTCCFDFIKVGEFYKIVLPSLSIGALHDLQHFIEGVQNGEYPVYLVDGDEVGLGTYGEPVITNVKLVGEFDIKELAEPEFKLDRTNIQLVKKCQT